MKIMQHGTIFSNTFIIRKAGLAAGLGTENEALLSLITATVGVVASVIVMIEIV